ncbi:hypothetical protein ACF3DV_10395 [Chlorogloeopsis fritschii PCC 9212]|uniref:hypothetical protein n=1 Tax=Chlorogloeopsis fritschii TaxID=1124 RepID=UPI0003067040|nr:hypothetical protein [Chlorogloeopsis fritschii]
MQVLLNKSLQALTPSLTGRREENTAIYTWHLMRIKHTCPCCSYTLLRHIDLKGIYWRCSHCYQEMPVYQPLQKHTVTFTNQQKMLAA